MPIKLYICPVCNNANETEGICCERASGSLERAGSASSWTVHWTSDDGTKPYHQDFKEAHEAGNWVRMLLEKGKTAVSVMVKE